MSKPKPKKHHEFSETRGEFDEVWVKNAFVHIERMDDKAFWIGIDPPKASGLPRIMLNTGVVNGQWYFNLEEDSLDGKRLEVSRPRGKRARKARA